MHTVANPHVTHEVELQTAYKMSGLMYVPHYRKPGVFVGPGQSEFSENHLQLFGAERLNLLLWPRKCHTS